MAAESVSTSSEEDMNNSNVLLMFQDILRVIAPVGVSPALRPFAVTMTFDGQCHEITVLAFKSCDAICYAIDTYFDGSDEMPDGMTVKASPANLLRAA